MAGSERGIELPLEEARRSLDHGIDTVDQQADHAIELIKVDLILLGSLPIVQSFGSEIPDIYLALVTTGVAISILLNFLAYYAVNSILGLDSEGIKILLGDAGDERSKSLSIAYANWISETADTNKRVRNLLAAGIASTTFSIGGLIGGIVL
jgi:hypothetical protein